MCAVVSISSHPSTCMCVHMCMFGVISSSSLERVSHVEKLSSMFKAWRCTSPSQKKENEKETPQKGGWTDRNYYSLGPRRQTCLGVSERDGGLRPHLHEGGCIHALYSWDWLRGLALYRTLLNVPKPKRGKDMTKKKNDFAIHRNEFTQNNTHSAFHFPICVPTSSPPLSLPLNRICHPCRISATGQSLIFFAMTW